MNTKLFSEYEGLLGDTAKLLIVLKEPHGDEWNCFWMKEKVLPRKEGTRYFNVLGAFTKKILGTQTKIEALAQCAFVNLYPYDGKASAEKDGGYAKMIRVWKKKEADEDLQKLLENRLKIIKNALDSAVPVVAPREIARQIKGEFSLQDAGPWLGDYPCYTDGKRTVFAISHPADQHLSYARLEELLGFPVREE